MKKMKISVLFLATILALSATSISYSLWSETLVIEGTATMGNVDIEWSLEGYGDDERKEISSIYAVIINEGNTLEITLDNVYPCVNYWVFFNIHSKGTVPVHFKNGFVGGSSASDYGQYLLDKGIVTIENVPVPSETHGYTVVTGPIENAQLHNCYAWFGHLNFHLTNELWNQLVVDHPDWHQGGGPYTFTISIMGHQYNEEPTGPGPDDTDGDGISDDQDNCPNTPNPDQNDFDGDGMGDACDPDDDNDGTLDINDGCPYDSSKTSPGECGCGVADTDTDGDGVPDCVDNCPNTYNPGQEDNDGDGIGDVCDDEIMHINNINIWPEQSEDCYYYMGMLIFCDYKTKGVAGIYIADVNNNPVQGAEVFGTWSGLASNSVNGITDPAGLVIFKSDVVEWSSLDPIHGDFTITIDNVVKTGWIYDPSANVETSDSISI